MYKLSNIIHLLLYFFLTPTKSANVDDGGGAGVDCPGGILMQIEINRQTECAVEIGKFVQFNST